MKKIINLTKIALSSLLISTFFVGCLDLKEDIKNAEDQDFSAVLDNLNSLVRPAYSSLRDQALYDSNGLRSSWGEVGIDSWSIPRFQASPFQNNTISSQEGVVENVWIALYGGVRICNDIINNIDELGENTANDEQRKDLFAQVRFVRSILYFNLVKIFENPVISSTEVVEDASEITSVIPNSSPGDVYQLIQNDLVYAINNLNPENAGAAIATVEAAKAMLGKVYMQIAGMMINNVSIEPISFALIDNENVDITTGEPEEVPVGATSSDPIAIYESAVVLFDDVIDSGKFELMQSYRDIFDPTKDGENTEVVFKVNFIPDGANNGSGFGDFGVGLQNGQPFGLQFRARTASREGMYSYYDTRLTDDQIFRKNFGTLEYPLPISDGRFLVNHFSYRVGEYNNTRDPNDTDKNTGLDVWEPAKWIKGNDATIADIGNRDFDFPLIRYSDVLLLKAEALIYSGTDATGAISLINDVRRRAYGIDEGATTTNAGSVDKLYFTNDFHNKGKPFEPVLTTIQATLEEKIEAALTTLKGVDADLADLEIEPLMNYYKDNFRALRVNQSVGADELSVEVLPTIKPVNGEVHDEFLPIALKVVTAAQKEIDGGLVAGILLEDLNSIIDAFKFASTPFKPLVEEGTSFDELKFILSRERRKEFAHEGHRKDDLIRFGAIDEVIARVAEGFLAPSLFSNDYVEQAELGFGVPYTDRTGQNSDRKPNEGWQSFKYRWPIPADELDLNPLLKQNSGY